MEDTKEQQLPEGYRVQTVKGKTIKVEKHLGGGGQGDVYVVDYGGQKKALKWYKELGTNPKKFRENLLENANQSAPSPAFLWPEDVTEWKDGTFGYIMDLKPEGYYELSQFLLASVKISWKRTIDACIEIVNAFRILHNHGYSYQDLNDGNFFINPKTGQVKIADNDNVAPEGDNLGILGKARYMAPEIVRGEVLPNTATDRYSLAMMLFLFLCRSHPLEGKANLTCVLTDKASLSIYGTKPLFIYDKQDTSNRPVIGTQQNTIDIWNCLPQYMKDIFISAFNYASLYDGQNNNRVRELDWLKVLVRFRSDIVKCSSCGNDIFTENGEATRCDVCGRPANVRVKIQLPSYSIPAVAGTRIYRIQMSSAVHINEALNPVGMIGEKGNVLGIINTSNIIWNCTTPSGKEKNVAPKEVAPVRAGISVNAYGASFIFK